MKTGAKSESPRIRTRGACGGTSPEDSSRTGASNATTDDSTSTCSGTVTNTGPKSEKTVIDASPAGTCAWRRSSRAGAKIEITTFRSPNARRPERLEFGVRARAVGERRPVRELLERQAPLGRGVTQPDDRLLALGIGSALLELAAHSSGI